MTTDRQEIERLTGPKCEVCGHPASEHPVCVPPGEAAAKMGSNYIGPFTVLCGIAESTILRAENERLRTQLASAQEDGARWQDYAIHLAHCRECGTSNLHCVRGQSYRDACFDNENAALDAARGGDNG